MGVVLQIPSEISRFCDGHRSFEFEASDVAMLLEQLWSRYPILRSRMLDRNDKIFSYFLLMHNDRQLAKLNLNDVSVADGDRITFIALAEGG